MSTLYTTASLMAACLCWLVSKQLTFITLWQTITRKYLQTNTFKVLCGGHLWIQVDFSKSLNVCRRASFHRICRSMKTVFGSDLKHIKHAVWPMYSWQHTSILATYINTDAQKTTWREKHRDRCRQVQHSPWEQLSKVAHDRSTKV